MIWEGMVEEGLSICRAIHERYHPLKRNPYNEVECSDHYARAMASWGVYLALAGFQYHGPNKRIGFAPRVTPNDFKTAFTVAEGWGTFEQRIEDGKQTANIKVAWGKLALKELCLDTDLSGDIQILKGGRKLKVTVDRNGRTVTIQLDRPQTLKAGQDLEVRFS